MSEGKREKRETANMSTSVGNELIIYIIKCTKENISRSLSQTKSTRSQLGLRANFYSYQRVKMPKRLKCFSSYSYRDKLLGSNKKTEEGPGGEGVKFSI